MTGIVCKRCAGADHVLNGHVRGHQRYSCRACGCNFTMTPPRGKPEAMKEAAVALYALGGMSFCGIARLLGVSDVAVLNWVRAKARQVPEPVAQTPADGAKAVVVIDEMWHFLKKSPESCGCGGHSIL